MTKSKEVVFELFFNNGTTQVFRTPGTEEEARAACTKHIDAINKKARKVSQRCSFFMLVPAELHHLAGQKEDESECSIQSDF